MFQKKLVVQICVLLLAVFYCSVSLAEMNMAEKKYRLILYFCTLAQSPIPAAKELLDFIEDPAAKKEALKKLESFDKKFKSVMKSTKAKKSQIANAGEDFLEAELGEIISIGNREDYKDEIAESLPVDKNAKNYQANLRKLLVFKLKAFQIAIQLMNDLFDLIDNPDHKNRIARHRAILGGMRSKIGNLISETEKLENKKFTNDEFENEIERLNAKLVPLESAMPLIFNECNAMYFEDFTAEDMMALFKGLKL
jgi:hypothetical protein